MWPIRKLQPDWMSLDENMVAPVHLPINNLDGNLSGVNLNGHARIIMHKNSEIIRHANNHLTRVNLLAGRRLRAAQRSSDSQKRQRLIDSASRLQSRCLAIIPKSVGLYINYLGLSVPLYF